MGYIQTTNVLVLFDGGGSCQLGQEKLLSTDYVTLNCRATTVSGEGDTLTIDWVVRPLQCFIGGCGVNRAFGLAIDSTGLRGGGKMGTWSLEASSSSSGI